MRKQYLLISLLLLLSIEVFAQKVIPPRKILADTPQKVKAYNNKVALVKPTPILVKKEYLETVTPGKNGTPLPEKMDLPVEIVRAKKTAPTLISPPSFKDAATQHIRYLDVDHGLPSSYYFLVFEDSRGYLWFGSWDEGVSRYDGHSLVTFRREEGFLDGWIREIFEDREGNLWFGTSNGFSKYDGINFTNYWIDDVFRDIFEDSKGRIWVTSESGGAGYFSETGDFIRLSEDNGLLSNHVTSIAEDKKGNIWFGTAEGICQYDGVSFIWFGEETGLPDIYISKLIIDQQDNIWLGMDIGMVKYDGKYYSHFTEKNGLPHHFVIDLMEDHHGNIWTANRRGGACSFDGQSFTYYQLQEGLSNIEVLSLSEDQYGQIWMVTYGGGICVLNPNSFSNYTINEGLSHNVINHIFEDSNKNIWMATEGGGVIKYDGAYFWNYTTQEGLSSNEIATITEDQQGNIWLGTFDHGAMKFDGTYFYYYQQEQGLEIVNVGRILEDSHGAVWLTTEEPTGIFKWSENQFKEYSDQEGMEQKYTLDLLKDNNKNLWIAGYEGLTRYDGESFAVIETKKNDLGNGVACLSKDSSGNIWMLVKGIGLCKYDGKDFSFWGKEEGLEDLNVWAIEIDGRGNIWVGTEKGIYLLDLEKGESDARFVSFHKVDGLKGEDIRHRSVCLDSNNQLWWGTGKSVNKLDLNKFYAKRDEQVSKVQLNNIFINENFLDFSSDTLSLEGKNIAFKSNAPYNNFPSELRVPFDLNHFTFDFVALNHSAPHKIQYRHRISGLEKEWSLPTTKNKIDYRSIPYGNYQFEVQARKEGGLWGETLQFPFLIQPPWWYSIWAYLGYLLILTGLVYLIFSFLRRRWILQNELKNKKEEAIRLKELDAFKSTFYTNITHEFRTPLTVILGMVQQIKDKPKEYLEEGSRLIERNGKKLLRQINQMLDLSKLETNSLQLNIIQGDIIEFLRYSTEAFQSFANGQNLSLRFFSPVENFLMDFDPDSMQNIMSNLISNAIKFTPDGGDVKVAIGINNEVLSIKVQDTGVGISEKNLPHIFDRFFQAEISSDKNVYGSGVGLAYVNELVKVLGGSIFVESELGKGTLFTVRFPVQQTAPMVNNAIDKSILTWKPTQQSNLEANKDLNVQHAIEQDIIINESKSQLLIIEDNVDVVIYLKSFLSDLYQVDVAYNGRIGIEKALQNIPDLIVSDVMMPDKDGFEVCDTLKNDERTSHIPLILLTAKADAASKIAGLQRGADAYLSKPFDKKELLVRLEMLVEKQKKLVAYFQQKNQAPENDLNSTGVNLEEAIIVEDNFIEKIKTILDENINDEDFGLSNLCQKVRMSRSQLFRKMKALTNTAPSAYIKTYRLNKAKHLLENTTMNVAEATYAVGFRDPSYFSKIFKEVFQLAPSDCKKN